ncbi:MAG: dolichyl-phosphate-mannose--protein mannosyltransferase [Actinomycetales bacterium]
MTRLYLVIILGISALLRTFRLGTPNELVFDEVYYVDGARDFLANGVELTDGKAEFVVHPPVGKWMIAIGMKLFGDDPFGWRISAALFGVASIYLIFLAARKLFNSDFLALLSAALASIDGLHLVMSRTALLDIFLMTFLLGAFVALLYQRYFLMALMLGLALGTKWSALYFIIAIAIYLLVKERKALISYSIIIPSVYLISWSGWFFSSNGWDRNSSSNSLSSLFNYHKEILNFHTNLKVDHSYEASPWNWLILGRPTSFFYASPKTCGADNCAQEILAMGTPPIWWVGLIAILVTIGYFIYRRDKSAGFILLGLLSNYLPWLLFPERTTFYFYAIAFQPFLILAIAFATKEFLKESENQRRIWVLSGFSLSALVFLYFAPLYLGTVLTYDAWYSRMWFASWI